MSKGTIIPPIEQFATFTPLFDMQQVFFHAIQHFNDGHTSKRRHNARNSN